MNYKELCKNFAPMVYKKGKKKWGAMGSTLIETDTEEEAYKEYYNYLINKGLIQ
jgi:hypothetical protein